MVEEVSRVRPNARAGARCFPKRRPSRRPPRSHLGIRLALQDVHGISDAEIRSILEARAERPFVDVGDFLRRTSRLAAGDRGVGARRGVRRSAAGEDVNGGTSCIVAMTADASREGDQLALADRAPVPAHRFARLLRRRAGAGRARGARPGRLAAPRDRSTEPLLEDLGVTRTKDSGRRAGADEWVMVAGVKVASQTPAMRSGQRIIFLTLDDGDRPGRGHGLRARPAEGARRPSSTRS